MINTRKGNFCHAPRGDVICMVGNTKECVLLLTPRKGISATRRRGTYENVCIIINPQKRDFCYARSRGTSSAW